MPELNKIKLERQTHPDISILSPFDIAVEYSENGTQDFKGDSHYALQICIVLSGEAELMLEDFSRTYIRGELWWNMCWEPHAYKLTGKKNLILAVNIDVEQLGSCSPFGGCNWLTPFVSKPNMRYCPSDAGGREFILDIGGRLYELYRNREQNWRISSWLLIHQLLIHAINRMDSTGIESKLEKESINSFSRIRQALNRVWASEARPPSLSEAAKSCSLSTSRFSELFRRTIGISYGKFATRVRMSNAAKDLMTGRFTLEEIALKWGFFDSAHFCHSFKKLYRISPSQFTDGKS